MSRGRRVVRARPLALPVVFALASALAGCGEGDGTTDPAFSPTVSSVVDTFRLAATATTPVTRALSYTFRNTGAAATVEQASAVTAGSAFVVLRDSTGTLLYSKDLSQAGTFASFAGEPGTWRVEISLADVTGSLDLEVRRKP